MKNEISFEESAAKVVSMLEPRMQTLSVELCSLNIVQCFGRIAETIKSENPSTDLVQLMLGRILINTIAQALASNGIAAEAYKLTNERVLSFGGAVTGLMQSTFCQYRSHAASHDLEKMVQGLNPMTEEQFKAISHERAESLANLYQSLRTISLEFNLSLEECITYALEEGIKI